MSNSPPPSSPTRHAPLTPSGLPFVPVDIGQGGRRGPRPPNIGTMLPSDPAMADVMRHMAAFRALPHQQAYAIALAANRLREPQAQVGYRLYWMSDVVLGCMDVYARPSGYAVVGRHDSCDLVLNDERLVSLRHVLVRASSLDDGFPVLSVLDLQSASGFELSDGSKQHSIAASGPVVFRIGTHSLVALPSSGRLPDTLPVPRVETDGPAPAAADDDPPRSRITLLNRSVDLSSRRSTALSPLSPEPSVHVSTGEGYEIVVEAGGRRAAVRLSTKDVEHGVLIGRAGKCIDEGLRSVLVGAISRVHVLVIREKGECHLYDVASLNGTLSEGRRVRCLPLSDAGSTIQLGLHTGVTLHFRAL